MSNTNFLVAGNLIKHFHCLLLPRIKNKYFCFFKERLCSIKRLLLFFTQFSKLILWRRSFPVLSTDACIALWYFCCFPMSVSKKRYIGRILILPDSYMWQKFNKMNEKRSLGYQSGALNMWLGKLIVVFCSFFETILLFDFCTVSEILICCGLIKRLPNNHL